MKKTQLILIGYWHSLFEPNLPDPAWFIDENWDELIKHKVIYHLKNGQHMPYAFAGHSWCRFRCGNEMLGSLELTDGKYVWPEGLAHYIEFHNIRLPKEIIDSFLNTETKDLDIDFEMDGRWWQEQKGWNFTGKTAKDLFDVGIITFEQKNHIQRLKQEGLLLNFLGNGHGIKKKLFSIDKIIHGEKISIKGRFKGYEDFSRLANDVGLKTSFEELNHEQYENENGTT